MPSKILEDFGERTTLHGCQNICNAKHRTIRRFLWFVVLTAMIGAYSYLLFLSLKKYFLFESSFNIKKVRNNTLSFPSVSICDQNLFPKSYLHNSSQEEILLKLHTDTNLTANETEESGNWLRQIHLSEIMLEPLKRFHDTFINCRVNNIKVNCRTIVEPTMSESTLCYTFYSFYTIQNIGQFNATKPGYMNGLQITMDIHREDYAITAANGIGIRIMVHEPHVLPRVNEKAISISPGVEAFVEIDRIDATNLPMPYSTVECRKNKSSPEFEIMKLPRYSYEGCMLECMYQNTFLQCNCDFNMANTPTINNTCTLYDYYFCMREKFHQYYTQDCGCLHSCEETWYDYRVSTLEIPSPLLLQRAKVENWKRQTPQDIKDNIIKMYIYYKSLEYTQIEQVAAYTFDTMVADFGGFLGLFLGASLITLLEILEFIIVVLFKRQTKSDNTINRVKHIDVQQQQNNITEHKNKVF